MPPRCKEDVTQFSMDNSYIRVPGSCVERQLELYNFLEWSEEAVWNDILRFNYIEFLNRIDRSTEVRNRGEQALTIDNEHQKWGISWISASIRLEIIMAGVINKFFIASLFMWVAPITILYGFNHQLIPGSTQLSSYSLTLLSGFLAVISVNVVIALYICMAMKEPSDRHEPDPAFLAEAKASISQATPSESEDASEAREKQE
ncbi:hypothetical protein NE237_003621 [Protea cynaroides]|uniref:Vacuolar ATPase assembly integral membrane protein VMA21 homolog n=1 Tax=Protea cynaroides TaxID=273540 RepID=A0A9Q0KHB2_9MAGN|nr:hypothetical protein NE237_003621 [Protea cynaroides]